MRDTKKPPLDVLWTSGWDSTFIVLEAVLATRLAARTHIAPQCA